MMNLLNTVKRLLPLLLLVIVFSACEKDDPKPDETEEDETETPVGSPASDFTASVDGTQWEAINVSAQEITQVSVINITGKHGSDVDISISVPSDIEPGTYNLSGNGDYVANVFPAGESISTHYSSEGEVTITKHDTENNVIEGTLQFTATSQQNDREYKIENGAFLVEYSEL